MSLDKELLSAYYDNEVPEQFVSRLEAMLDDEDKALLAEFDEMSTAMHDMPEPQFDSQKVLNNIQMEINRPRKISFWKKRLTIPAPLVAAAAAFMFASPFIFTGFASGNSIPVAQTLSPNKEMTVTVKAENFEQVLQMIKAEERSVQFELPFDDMDFQGEPTFLKAVDLAPGMGYK